VVKPVSGRASLNVHVVPDVAALADTIAEVYRVTENAVLIEQFVSGREVCIAVAGPIIAPRGRLSRGTGPFTFAPVERVLDAGEQIFTSMDKRPITEERLKLLDSDRDANLLEDMRRLARDTYLEFNLGSLIRLDLRADENGNLFVLEANPKPDLKMPAQGVTSLICAGLPEIGMNYDDLILCLLADRFNFLATHRRSVVQHLFELIEQPNLFDFMDLPSSKTFMGMREFACARAETESAADIVDIAADLSVQALNATIRTAKTGDEKLNPRSVVRHHATRMPRK
jgi:D-alanine-D-alanine ligase